MTLQDFQAALDKEFLGTLRARWSPIRGAYLLEQKALRGVFDTPLHEERGPRALDERIQLRDGYRFFMEVREYPKMPCLQCGVGLRLKPFETIQARCPRCGDHRPVACFPLGDLLLDYLRRLNPANAHREKVRREVDEANERRESSVKRDGLNHIESANLDQFNTLFEIPQFGYATKTGAWPEAPASPLSPTA